MTKPVYSEQKLFSNGAFSGSPLSAYEKHYSVVIIFEGFIQSFKNSVDFHRLLLKKCILFK